MDVRKADQGGGDAPADTAAVDDPWALLAPHIPALRRYLYVLHNGNLHDAEDSLQEGLLRAIERLESFRGPAGFKSWLFSVCRNAALDGFRKNRRRREYSGDWERLLDGRASTLPGPEELVLSHAQRETVIDALMELSPRFRMPLMLKEIEGMSIREISEILGLPEGTVKSRLSTGRKKLAAQFTRLYAGKGGFEL